tara:strand:+ start:2319 stop:2513 length:195 start_codon:yes stop_codon:yes gene_type:complete
MARKSSKKNNKKKRDKSLRADVKDGILTNDAMEKTLKRLGITHKDLLKIKPSGSGPGHTYIPKA